MSPVRESEDSFGNGESADYLDKLQLFDIKSSNETPFPHESIELWEEG